MYTESLPKLGWAPFLLYCMIDTVYSRSNPFSFALIINYCYCIFIPRRWQWNKINHPFLGICPLGDLLLMQGAASSIATYQLRPILGVRDCCTSRRRFPTHKRFPRWLLWYQIHSNLSWLRLDRLGSNLLEWISAACTPVQVRSLELRPERYHCAAPCMRLRMPVVASKYHTSWSSCSASYFSPRCLTLSCSLMISRGAWKAFTCYRRFIPQNAKWATRFGPAVL